MLVDGLLGEPLGQVERAPETINDDPYGDGWLVRVKLSDPAEVDTLLDVTSYRQLLTQ